MESRRSGKSPDGKLFSSMFDMLQSRWVQLTLMKLYFNFLILNTASKIKMKGDWSNGEWYNMTTASNLGWKWEDTLTQTIKVKESSISLWHKKQHLKVLHLKHLTLPAWILIKKKFMNIVFGGHKFQLQPINSNKETKSKTE